MARDWHEQFKRWSKPPSATEEEKGKNAATMIREAIRASPALDGKRVDVYATGSYRNNTNVRLDSDIDVAVVLRDSFFYTSPAQGPTTAQIGGTASKYGYSAFRDDVEQALLARFGKSGVDRGNKSFDINANTYRLEADVAVFLEHRRYTGRRTASGWEYHEGVELRPRNAPGTRVINWHQQHYDAGVDKNLATGKRYKRVARILKNLKNDLEAGSLSQKGAATAVPSFLLECLAFNAPISSFQLASGTYYHDVQAVLAWLWHQTKAGADEPRFTEVSGLKWLFDNGQPWSIAAAHRFVDVAWRHVGFDA